MNCDVTKNFALKQIEAHHVLGTLAFQVKIAVPTYLQKRNGKRKFRAKANFDISASLAATTALKEISSTAISVTGLGSFLKLSEINFLAKVAAFRLF